MKTLKKAYREAVEIDQSFWQAQHILFTSVFPWESGGCFLRLKKWILVQAV